MPHAAAIIDPRDLHFYWPLVRDDIAYCAAQDSDEVWPEDVYASIRYQAARLVVATDGEKYTGMAVVTARQDPFNPRNNKLIVWLCRTHSPEAMQAGFDAIERMAGAEGYSVVSFHGSRQSFDRWGRRNGFEFDSVAMHKQVNQHDRR